MAQDIKTASQEYVFETLAELAEVEFQKSQLKAWMQPVEAPVPRFLAKTGHKGMVYREPYGVALIILHPLFTSGQRERRSGNSYLSQYTPSFDFVLMCPLLVYNSGSYSRCATSSSSEAPNGIRNGERERPQMQPCPRRLRMNDQ
jgi:hypothetical protein